MKKNDKTINTKEKTKLCKLRKEKEYTQEEIAAALKIDDSTYARYEKDIGTMPVRVLIDLVEILEVPIETILYGDSETSRGMIEKNINFELKYMDHSQKKYIYEFIQLTKLYK